MTLLAEEAITSGWVMSLPSITVPAAVIVDGPVYGVRDTPAGTPVLDALGNAPVLAAGGGAAAAVELVQPFAFAYSSLATIPPITVSILVPCWIAETQDLAPAGSIERPSSAR